MKMQRIGQIACLMLVLAATFAPAAGATEPTQASVAATAAAPPDRPLRVTPAQLAALEQLAASPDCAVAPDTRAAYSPDAQELASEAGAVGVYGAWFGIVAFFLLTAV